MYSFISLVLCSLLAVVLSSDVLDLTDADFKDRVAEHDVLLVEFYAPWCGHCKRLAPEYEKAATKLKNNDPPIHIAKVDCTEQKSTCDKYGVSGFPTLKIFRDGELSSDYSGPREADGIVKFMRGQGGPSSKELTTLAEFEKFIANDDHSIVGFFKAAEDEMSKQFQKLAGAERENYRFAHTMVDEILEKHDTESDIMLFMPKRLHNKFEESIIKYDGGASSDKIIDFVKKNFHGLAGHRTMDNAMSFERPLITVYYNVDYTKDPKGTNYWRNRVLKVAQDYKDGTKKATFAVSSKADFAHELEEFGMGDRKEETKPLVAIHGDKGDKYVMSADFSVDSLKSFVDKFFDGQLVKYMKSEPVPEPNDGPVKVVVAKNFNEIVNQDKDVLIEFYAPWCGHCKSLAPIYDDLGEKLKDESEIVIAKMDATANDVPAEYQVQGFPTLFWVPKGSKDKPKNYDGGRDLKEFMKYISKNATNKLKGYDRNGKKKAAKDEV